MSEDLPQVLGDLEIMIHGEAITLPMAMEDFLERGWEPYEDDLLEITLEPKQMWRHELNKGDQYASTFVANLSDDESCTVRQGTIVGFEYPEVWELPGGIKPGVSTKDDAIAVYGGPDSASAKYVYFRNSGFNLNFSLEESGVIRGVYIIFSAHNDFANVR